MGHVGAGKEQLNPFPIPGLFCGNMKHVTWENLPEEGRAKLWTAFHRILEWFGLDGTFKYHLIQSPHHEQEHPLLHQVAQRPIHPGFALGSPAVWSCK